MVAYWTGFRLSSARRGGHPGDLRWPSRRVALLIALYLALFWCVVVLLARAAAG